jgi:ADP-ribose pyrophosphatase YjhB (NUDIX family)
VSEILSILPKNAEIGVGLAINYGNHYLFFLAGERHNCPPKEIFYAGIGGHLEKGESLLECAHREAKEEIDADIEIINSPITYYISKNSKIQEINVKERIKPFAVYEMIHPKGTPNEGKLYYIVIFKSRLVSLPKNLKRDEVQGIIALTEDQIIKSLTRKSTLGEIKREGATIVAGAERISDETALYPIGTAKALAYIFLTHRKLNLNKNCR